MSTTYPFQKKFARRQEDFQCDHCGAMMTGNGYTNHCSQCLFSKHVDINPGDRASPCQGLMRPLFQGLNKKGAYILHKCTICGHQQPNKTAPQDDAEIFQKLPFQSGPV